MGTVPQIDGNTPVFKFKLQEERLAAELVKLNVNLTIQQINETNLH